MYVEGQCSNEKNKIHTDPKHTGMLEILAGRSRTMETLSHRLIWTKKSFLGSHLKP